MKRWDLMKRSHEKMLHWQPLQQRPQGLPLLSEVMLQKALSNYTQTPRIKQRKIIHQRRTTAREREIINKAIKT